MARDVAIVSDGPLGWRVVLVCESDWCNSDRTYFCENIPGDSSNLTLAGAVEFAKEFVTRPESPVCAHCNEKRPAVCFGRYEDMGKSEYACAECCGHGNEDGHCFSIVDFGDE